MRRPKSLIIASHIVDNWKHRARFLRGDVRAAEGATHRNWPLSKSLEYIDHVFRDYLLFGGLAEDDLAGRSVLEVGPGDNLGVALKFIAAGASRVVCLDKVYSIRDRSREEAIHRALREQFTRTARARYDDAVDLRNGIAIRPERIKYLYGTGIEEASNELQPASFDLIVSRAVLMEIHSGDMGLGAMDRLLRPGGLMVHKIAPCHDYGMFTANGYSPLEYLTAPGWLYKRMTRDSGKPNRRLIGDYRSILAALGYSAEFHIVGCIGSGAQEFPPGTFSIERGVHYPDEALALVRETRPRLCPEYRSLPDEDLLITGAFLVARKPAPATTHDDEKRFVESSAIARSRRD